MPTNPVKAATNVDQILSSSLIGIDAILDGGYLVDGGLESTIVDLSKQGPPRIIREGAIKSTEIYDTLSREGSVINVFNLISSTFR